MAAAVIAILLALLPSEAGLEPRFAAAAPVFQEHFTGETMRVELYQVGDAREELVTLNRVYRDGPWAGPRSPLIDPFTYARYGVEVRDAETGETIYQRWFDTMFGEYPDDGTRARGTEAGVPAGPAGPLAQAAGPGRDPAPRVAGRPPSRAARDLQNPD